MSPNSTKFGGVSSSPGDFLTSAPNIPQDSPKTAENLAFAALLDRTWSIISEIKAQQAQARAELAELRADLARIAASTAAALDALAALERLK